MNAIKKFIKQFTNKRIEGIEKVGREYFLVNKNTMDVSEKINREPFSMGILLGDKKKEFKPTPALLDLIAKQSDRKVFINREAEWLFLCGRDIFEVNIVKQNVDRGVVLVQNERDENLGFGLFKTQKGNKLIKNILDKGYYLRREK
ncbi:hypothetical protein ACFLTH_08520 [Bacteroidota bacterium]